MASLAASAPAAPATTISHSHTGAGPRIVSAPSPVAWTRISRAASADTASDLEAAIDSCGGPEGFAAAVRDRQRTSTRGRVLKAEAVFRAAHLMIESGIEKLTELREHADKSGPRGGGCRVNDARPQVGATCCCSQAFRRPSLTRRFCASSATA